MRERGREGEGEREGGEGEGGRDREGGRRRGRERFHRLLLPFSHIIRSFPVPCMSCSKR